MLRLNCSRLHDEMKMAALKAESIIKYYTPDKLHTDTDSALNKACESVVIFGQYDCGTGVNIAGDGLLLTCAHCLGSHPRNGTKKVVIFTSGLICLAISVAVDTKRDTALLKIIGTISQDGSINTSNRAYPFSVIHSGSSLPRKAPLVCVGQPGVDDLESDVARKTNYSVVHVSRGRYQGVLGGDLRDNSEIGQLIHDCWTYWGHSGAPLFTTSGQIAGIHSSWDDEMGSRHGIHYIALAEFVAPHLQLKDEIVDIDPPLGKNRNTLKRPRVPEMTGKSKYQRRLST